MTLNGHYALCFKTRASFGLGAHHEYLNEDIPYYQRRSYVAQWLWQCKVYVDIRGGSQDYVNFPDFMPAPLYYVYRKRHAVVVLKFNCLFMTVSYGCRGLWTDELIRFWRSRGHGQAHNEVKYFSELLLRVEAYSPMLVERRIII